MSDRALLAELFPQLGIRTFEPVLGGWTSRTYLVNGTWILQVPADDRAAATMLKQQDVLAGLEGELSAAVPVPELISRDPTAMGYRRIEGTRSDEVGDEGVWPERLGRFLYDLHLVPPEFVGMRPPSMAELRAERGRELDGFRERVFPLLSEDERSTFAERFTAFLDDESNWRFAPCLTHGDLGPEHVLVTPGGDLGGVIDWEDAAIGDPVWDFAWLLNARPDAGERALAAYGGPPDAGFRARGRFGFSLMPWHEVLYGLDSDQGSFVRRGLDGIRARSLP